MFESGSGFLGTSASLAKDVTLVIEVVFYITLCLGVAAQLGKQYKLHDWLQIPVVLLNLLFIGAVMLPSFVGVAGTDISQTPTAVAMIHGVLGTIAQGLAIYCLLAGLKILPRKIGVLRYWMWAAFFFWTVTVLFGVITYIVWYGMAPATGGVGEHDEAIITEHDEDFAEQLPLVPSEETAETEETVDEHAEDVAETEQTVDEHAEDVTETEQTVDEHAADEPIDQLIDEHAEESSVMPDEERDSMAQMIDEHMEAMPDLIETEFTGEMAQASWTLLQPVNAGPSIRYEHAMQYHPATQQLFLFGGRDGSKIYNDVWVLDVPTLTWQEIGANSATKPTPRYSTVLIVDSTAENLYVATGHSADSQTFNDIWQFNIATETWTDLSGSAGQPPAIRYGNPGVNIGDKLVLTHGFGTQRHDDTWQFNTATNQWEDITPAGNKPLLRCLFASAPSSGDLVIHGGCATPNGPCFLDDTWRLDMESNQWTEIVSEVKPMGRQYQTLVAGADGSNRLILYGGQDATRSARNDLWYLDLVSGEWQKVNAPNGPSERYNHAAVWLPATKSMLVYGGRNSEGGLGDLWQLSLQ